MSQIIEESCRMSILRLWRVAVSNLRISCVTVSNLGVWGPRDVLAHPEQAECRGLVQHEAEVVEGVPGSSPRLVLSLPGQVQGQVEDGRVGRLPSLGDVQGIVQQAGPVYGRERLGCERGDTGISWVFII